MASRVDAAMIEFYPQIKSAHVAAVIASGTLFALRGALVLGGVRWAMAASVRWLSYGIDTALLTAALMLLTTLKLNPFLVPWLAVKLCLLIAYVALGSLALSRARTWPVRATCYGCALLVFGSMASVALAHHPLGWIRLLAP